MKMQKLKDLISKNAEIATVWKTRPANRPESSEEYPHKIAMAPCPNFQT